MTVNRVSIGSVPIRHQAIIWINAGILLIGLLGTKLSEIWIEIQNFHEWKCIWKCRQRNGNHFDQGGMSSKHTHWYLVWYLFATIITESPEAAEMATKAVKVTYTDIEPCILSTKDGVEKNSFFPKLGDNIDHGDVEGKINWPMCVSAVSIWPSVYNTQQLTTPPITRLPLQKSVFWSVIPFSVLTCL